MAAPGALAEGAVVRGVLVREGFDQALITPEELHHHAKLAKGRISQRQVLPLHGHCAPPLPMHHTR